MNFGFSCMCLLLEASLYFFVFFYLDCSAGIGVLNMAAQAASRIAGNTGASPNHQFYLLDKDVWFCT